MEPEIKVGDAVSKRKGYVYEGIVVAKFHTSENKLRFVVEEADSGMLHIFNADQLELAGGEYGKTIEWRVNNRGAIEDRIYYMVKELMREDV